MAEPSCGDVFERAGFERCQPAILQPADIFLDRSGDAIRRRLFTVSDAMGGEYCLRPEFTIPVCRDLISAGSEAARVWYEGPIFRLGRGTANGTNEMLQAGIEIVGGQDALADDVETFALMRTCCGSAMNAATVTFGDLGLFDAVLEAVDLPAHWRGRLRKHFWHADVFALLLRRIGGEVPSVSGEAGQLLGFIRHLGRDAAKAAVHDMLTSSGIKPIGGRTIEEITARFLEKAEDAASDLATPEIVTAIETFLALKAPLDRAPDVLAALAKTHGLALDPAIDAVAKRGDALIMLDAALGAATFAPAFGREIEYYTGFVFEVQGQAGKLAGGGRYDGLMEALGARQAISAVGGAVWPARVQATGSARP